MPAQRFVVSATSNDAIATSEIRRVEAPSIVNLFASGTTKGNQVGLLLGKTEILPNSNINIEVAADCIDLSRDGMVRNILVGAGELRVPIAAITTETQFHLQHDVVTGAGNGMI